MQLSSAIVLAGALLANGIAVERATIEECDAVDPQIKILLSQDPLIGEEFCSELLSQDASSTESFESTIFVTTTITSVIATAIVTADAVTTTEIM